MGDSHGHYNQLKEVVEKSGFDPKQDLIVFLGDYIDRGYHSFKCLEYVRSLKERFPNNVVVLKGNHEDMMDEYFLSHDIASNRIDLNSIWMSNGGDNTFGELVQLTVEQRRSYLEFIRSLPTQHIIPIIKDGKSINLVFCHAGINPTFPINDQSDFDLLWIRDKFFCNYDGDDIIIVGHTMVQNFGEYETPIDYNNIILCDTGSYLTGGHVSCVDVLEKMVWQSSPTTVEDTWEWASSNNALAKR